MTECPNCASNEASERGENPWAVARLTTGYVNLSRNQYYWGSCFFVARACVAELHELPTEERHAHLVEMSEVAAAIWDAVRPRKLNYEALGNTVPHLHWWLTPRHAHDPRPHGPIWEDQEFLQTFAAGGRAVTDVNRYRLRSALLEHIQSRNVVVEQSYV